MRTKFTLLTALLFIWFAGIAQQPVPNGGLETWTSISTPAGWSTIESVISPLAGAGLSEKDSTDKVEGTASIKLTSKYIALANDTIPGMLSIGTGFFTGSELDFYGTPFTSKPDTLFISYKYTPVGNDTAAAQIGLHKAGGGSNDNILGVSFPLTSTNGQWVSTYAVLTPYYSTGSCDTLWLQFASSIHGDGGSSLKAAVGSTLNVDDIRFGYAQQQSGGAPNAYTLGRDPLTGYDFNLYGALNTQNQATTYNFIYSTDSTFTASSTTPVQNKTNNTLEVVWATVTGLLPDTTYYYYLTANNGSGTTSGAIKRFYSDTIPFQFANSGADVYGASYAELHGRLNGFPFTANLSFEFGLSPDAMDTIVASDYPTVSDANTHYFRGYPNSSSLVPGNLYFFRIKAAGTTDTIYTDIRAFYTGNPYTTLQAMPATNVTTTTATLNANVQGFQVPVKIKSEIDGPGVSHKHTPFDYHEFSTNLINYTYNATGLQPNSYYTVRLKADTWMGNYYGDTAFTTLTTGIHTVSDAAGDVVVFPNPASSNLTVEWTNNLNSKSTLQLLNVNGQLVKEVSVANGQNKVLLPVADFAAGSYTLRLVTESGVYNQKTVIIK